LADVADVPLDLGGFGDLAEADDLYFNGYLLRTKILGIQP
jgi:hypothetical protein